MQPQPDPRVLVVEDDKDTGILMRQLLSLKLSADITMALDCAQAREKLASMTFDLVTLDYQLPDGDGLQILGEITSQEIHPPVLMVTGHGDEQTAAEAFKLGASGYVVKDKRLSTLLVEEAEKALELSRAIDALSESEQRLRFITDNMADVICQLDKMGNILYISPSVEPAMGYKPEDLLGKNASEFVHPEDLEQLQDEQLDSIKRHDSTVLMEYRGRRASGDYIWIEGGVQFLYDTDGEYTGAIFSARDTTARRQVQELTRAQRDLALELGGEPDVSKVIELALKTVLDITGLDCGGVYLVDAKTGDLDLLHHVGLSGKFIEGGAHLERWSPAAEHVFDGEPMFVPHQGYLPSDEARRIEGLRFIAVVPLRYGGEVFGSFNVASHGLDDIPENMKGVIEGLAGLVGQAVGRARLIAALQASEKRYRLLYENIGQPIYTFDTNLIMTDVNRKALEMLGYSKEEVIGKNAFDLEVLHPEDVQRSRESVVRPISGQFVGELRYRFVMKNGDVRNVVIIPSPMEDENGEILGVAVSVTDVTELERAVEALRESEVRYRLMHEYMGVALFAYDRDAILTDVNRKACEMFGYTSEELLGKSIFEISVLRPEDVKTAKRNAGLLLSGQEVVSTRYSFVRKDGDLLPVNVTSAALKDENGETVGVTSVAIEITE